MIGEYLATLVYWFFEILVWVLIVRVLLSWFGNPFNWFTRIVYQIADPVLNIFKRFIPNIGMIDISPIVAIVVLNLVSRFLMQAVLAF